jgi:hypothetical protein
MIEIRGGLQALGWDGALAMILSVYVQGHDFRGLTLCSPKFSGDVISSTIAFSKPKLDCPKVSGTHLDMLLTVTSSPTRPLEEMDTALLYYEIFSLVRSISELATNFLEHSNIFTSSTAIIIQCTQVISAIEHRLLSLRVTCSSEQPSDLAVLYVIEMVRIAALISTTYYFRSMKITSATISSLQKRLVAATTAFEFVSHDFYEESSMKLLLWACWLGGLTAKDQDWFAIRIHGYMQSMKLYGWRDLECFLDGFVLAPRRHDLHGGMLWRRVSQHSVL